MQFDMIFEGGGAKGMVFIGALQALEAQGHTSRRLVGTSAGAITATLLSVGYTAAEMQQALGETGAAGNSVFASFMDSPSYKDFTDEDIEQSEAKMFLDKIDIPLVTDSLEDWAERKIIQRLLHLKAYPTLFLFAEKGGLYLGNVFLNWLQKKLDAKDQRYSAMTLAELHAATGRDLTVVATDTSAQDLLVLNHRTAPNCPIVWAVRMSMSIPFAWQEVRWQSAWDPLQTLNAAGTAVQSRVNLADHSIVDGGVLSNFPLNMLISDAPSVRAVMGNVSPDRDTVLGLLIDETLNVAGAPPAPEESKEEHIGDDVKKLRTVQRVLKLAETMARGHDNQVMAANEELICRLPAKTYGTMEFDMTDERKEALISSGRKAMEEHLARR